MVDEAHMSKATVISKIINNCNAAHRYAFSGTIDGGKFVNRLTIQSLFGPIIDTTTTRKLIDEGRLTETTIKCLLLKHKTKLKKSSYQDEIKYLLECDARNDLIVKLALSSSKKGNTLVLFNVIEHGKLLAEKINDATDQPVFYIAGEIKGAEREEIRLMMEKETNAILVASYGTLAIGVNIPSLAALIFTHPTKSMVRVLQSIGRILRKSDSKTSAVVIDLADDLSGGRASKNHTLNHFLERVRIYAKQKFNYTLTELPFGS
jgi:superfamily II DNA or RNA helicase